MAKLYFFAAVILVACWTLPIRAENDDMEAAWNKYKSQHVVKAASAKELSKRKANFASVHAKIQEHNKKSSSFKMEHNALSQLSSREKRAMLGFQPSNSTGRFLSLTGSNRDDLPEFVDNQMSTCMPAVKDQGGCTGSWAFAATAVVEFGLCLQNYYVVTLSEQQLIDCDSDNRGCWSGNYGSAWWYLFNAKGQNTDASYPYTATEGTCAFNPESVAATVAPDVQYIQSGDVTAMETVLANNQLIAVGIAVTDTLYNYAWGVYKEPDCFRNVQGHHAVVIVGYGYVGMEPDYDSKYWIVRNSWGANWGESGYVRFQRGVNLCNIEQWPATVAVSKPPEPSPPEPSE